MIWCSCWSLRWHGKKSYSSFIIATEETALYILCKRKKVKTQPLSSYTQNYKLQLQITNAWKEVFAAKQQYDKKPTRTNFKNITLAQKQLDDAYAIAVAKFILGKLVNNSCYHTAKQHLTIWKLINKFAGHNPNHQSNSKAVHKKTRKWTGYLILFRFLVSQRYRLISI